MVDALAPYVDTLTAQLSAGTTLARALSAAAEAANQGAIDTAPLRPALGRARPLADKSIGHPDAGATSLALIAERIAKDAS